MKKPIIEVKNLKKHFAQKGGLFSGSDSDSTIPAVDDISFHVYPNETLGLVGESGCGKTTSGKAILKLNSVTDGQILYNGTDITSLKEKEFRPYRKDIQMIFQDLDAALNPTMKIYDVLKEAVMIHNKELSEDQVKSRIKELMEMVNLQLGKLTNFPTELSGGEKRRVGIARALAVQPKFIVADEPTSALDVSIQAQVVNLMLDLQKNLGLSYLFISHDLHLVEILSHRIAVMYLGRIVEMGPAKAIAKTPKHPYTQILWSSLGDGSAKEADSRPQEEGTNWGVYDFARPTGGCRFAPRCPIYAEKGQPALCTDPNNEPRLQTDSDEHIVACHFPLK
ncbi:MAG: ABC transporter ATP-binding protein [Gammaproteobacteria bacterium]|nr:ABC transporter ATP-binding protein [Gammaproteobacteria bacterium]